MTPSFAPHMLAGVPAEDGARCTSSLLRDTHHADETLVSVPSQYLPLQLSDSGLQGLHGGGRGLLLCYSEREARKRETGKETFSFDTR